MLDGFTKERHFTMFSSATGVKYIYDVKSATQVLGALGSEAAYWVVKH